MSSKPTSRIEDAGEKLGGARKDDDHNSNHMAVEVYLLDQLWPKPDNWRDLLITEEPERAVALMVMRDNVAKGPHPAGYFKQTAEFWKENYVLALQTLQNVLLTHPLPLNTDSITTAFNMALTGLPGWQASNPKRFVPYAVGKAHRKTVKHPMSLTPIEDARFRYLVKMGWATDTRVPDNFSFGAVHLTQNSTGRKVWAASRARAGMWEYLSRERHETEAAAVAEAYAAAQVVLKEAEDKAPVKRKVKTWKWNRPAVDSEIMRHSVRGPNATGTTTESLIQRFGIRGLEFGNWIPQSERQEILDLLHDSLSDLVHLFGLPDQFASLGGKLGFAFGSRGKGLSKAAAHFEPGQWIIHLTRRTGAGALAHEFAHALDHFIADRNWLGHAKYQGCKYSSSAGYDALTQPWPLKKNDVPVIRAVLAWRKELHDTYRRSPGGYGFYHGAMALDSLEGGKRRYWADECELFARSFEAYVYDALSTNTEKNEYLVFGVDQPRQEQRLMCGDPQLYPVGVERKRLNECMRSIVDSCSTVWTRPTVSVNPIAYTSGARPTPRAGVQCELDYASGKG